MKELIYILTFLIIGALSVSAYAQSAPTSNKDGIRPRFGYYKAQDAEDGTMFFGAQMRIRGKSVIGAEFAGEYRGTQSYSTTGGTIDVKQIL